MGFLKNILVIFYIQLVFGDRMLRLEFNEYINQNKEKKLLDCCEKQEEAIQTNCSCNYDIKICVNSLCTQQLQIQSVVYKDDFRFIPGVFNPYTHDISNIQSGKLHLHIEVTPRITQKRRTTKFNLEINMYDVIENLSAVRYIYATTVPSTVNTKSSPTSLKTNIGIYDVIGDICSYNPCLHEGVCRNVSGFYKCHCDIRYTGLNCESKRSCDQIICQNNGVCNDVEGEGFTCLCGNGFNGVFCETNIGEVPIRKIQNTKVKLEDETGKPFLQCPSTSCKNKGVCVSGTCQCPTGYDGDLCHYEKLQCEDNFCHNRSLKCIDGLNGYNCVCPFGYSGKDCKTLVQATTIKPCPICSNGGTCIRDVLGPFCLCPDGFTGETCSTFINTTSPITIQGKCVQQDSCVGGHYFCDNERAFCRSGWKGSSCKARSIGPESDPECPDILCKNDGFCFNGTCCCRKNYTGKYCEELIVSCPRNPCKNGGKCTVVRNSYICSCTKQFTGKDCTIPVTTSVSTSATVSTTTTSTTASTTVSATTTPITTTTSTHVPTTTKTSTTQSPPSCILYMNGRIKHKYIEPLRKLISKVLQDTLKDPGCNVDSVESHQMIDKVKGNYATEVRINTHTCSIIRNPSDRYKFMSALRNSLDSVSPDKNQKLSLYENDARNLDLIKHIHKLYLNGFVYGGSMSQIGDKLAKAWKRDLREAGDVNITLIRKDFVIGNYGIRVTQILYLASTNGSLIMPTKDIMPKTSTLESVITNEKPYLNTVYTGSKTFMYRDSSRISLLMTKRAMIPSQSTISTELSNAWTAYVRANLSECLGNCSVTVMFAREEPGSKYIGTDTRSIVYFPLIEGKLATDLVYGGPQVTGLPLCQCIPRRERYIDINGRIKLKDVPQTENSIKAAFHVQSTRQCLTFLQKQHLLNRRGDLITRMRFILSTNQNDSINEWPNPNMGDNIADLIQEVNKGNRTTSLVPGKMMKEIILSGIVNETAKPRALKAVHDAWSESNTNIPKDKIRPAIERWSHDYFSEDGGHATRVQYVVTIGDADSSLADVEDPDADVISRQASNSGVLLCGCIARHVRQFGVVGNINVNNKTMLERALESVWIKINKGLNVNITAHIRTIADHYETKEGEAAKKIEYYISVSRNKESIDEDDLDSPADPVLKADLQSHIPNVEIHTEPLIKSKSEQFKWWIVALAVVGGSLVFILLVAMLMRLFKRYGNTESRNLLQKPEDIDEFDKEHFSEGPDFDNPSYGVGDVEVNQSKIGTYTVNGN